MISPGTGIRRVLIVDHASIIGGAEVSLETLVTGMPQDRVRYTIVLPGPGPMVDRLSEKGLKVALVRMEGWRWWVEDTGQAMKFLLTFPFQLVSLFRWLFFLRRTRPDLIHFNINRLVEPVLAAWFLRIPSVMHFRDIPSRMSLRFIFGWRGFYALMNLAKCWIANSHATAQDIQPHARRPVSVIPNAIDLEDFDRRASDQSSLAKQMLSSRAHHVAMVGLLNPWKNLSDFVQLASIISRNRDDVTFYIVGAGNQTYEVQLRAQVKEMGLEGCVRFLGYVNCIPGFLSQMDLLAHTTSREPFGRVFIEAMAARKPVVAFDNGGAVEIVVNGETGLLVPEGGLNAMADAVSYLLDNPECRTRMGEAGRRRVEDQYALAGHCEAVLNLYIAITSPT